jgi:membrane fusion protein (multidrug efflux system)
VLVVGPDDKIVKKLVTDEGLHRNRWIVTQGIAPGDRVVIEGSGKARPGQAVHAVLSTGSQAEAAAIDPTPAAGKGKDGRSGAAR